MTIVESFDSGEHHRMTDHPGWRTVNGERKRAFSIGGKHLVLGADNWSEINDEGHLKVDSFGLGQLGGPSFGPLATSLGTAERIRNPNLWDAIGTAIIRQVIRAPQARKMYQEFCRSHGEEVLDSDGIPHWLFPSPQRVLDLNGDEFRAIGMAFKRKGLRSAASAYLAASESWEMLPPETLIVRLQEVSHIGPWTAKAAVADFSNAWALYPYDDLAVRTWAQRAIPGIEWAKDEAAFGEQWRELGGDHIADVTLLTLAWGDRHGGSGRVDGTSGGD